jgi:serine protease Do
MALVSKTYPRAGLAVAGVFAAACTHSLPEAEQKSAPRSAGSPPAANVPLTDQDGKVISDVAARALPAVVSVASTRVAKMEAPEGLPFADPFFRFFFGPNGPGDDETTPLPHMPHGRGMVEHGLGSGVLVGNGLVLTNAHVVADAQEIVVTAEDKRILKAKVAGTDKKSDLAVLKITSDTSGLAPLEFADSSTLKLGQIVLAIGYPFGLGGTVTMGIISAKGRANLGIADYEDFVQTDAAINPGNSGGALVDLSGRLVGVPTAILSRSGGYMGVGFAIPSNMAKSVMSDLLEHGHVNRGFLGVAIQSLDGDLAEALHLKSAHGVLVSEVTPGTPAAKAGLKAGDVVLAVNGTKVESTGEFRNLIAGAGANGKVDLDVVRAGKEQHVSATLTKTPDEPEAKSGAAAAASSDAGIRLAPLDPALRKKLDLPADAPAGALVEAVEPGSPADESGLHPGDVILELDNRPVTSGADFSDRLSKQKGPVALRIWREGRALYLVLKH